MFALGGTRRQMFGGAGLVAAVGMTAMLPRAAAGQGAARSGRISGAGRSHQGAGRHDGGRRRHGSALAIRERGALVQSDQDRLVHPDAERLRHHHPFRAAL